jgi:hypothetical protein
VLPVKLADRLGNSVGGSLDEVDGAPYLREFHAETHSIVDAPDAVDHLT